MFEVLKRDEILEQEGQVHDLRVLVSLDPLDDGFVEDVRETVERRYVLGRYLVTPNATQHVHRNLMDDGDGDEKVRNVKNVELLRLLRLLRLLQLQALFRCKNANAARATKKKECKLHATTHVADTGSYKLSAEIDQMRERE